MPRSPVGQPIVIKPAYPVGTVTPMVTKERVLMVSAEQISVGVDDERDDVVIRLDLVEAQQDLALRVSSDQARAIAEALTRAADALEGIVLQ